jgi:hypothetical protein
MNAMTRSLKACAGRLGIWAAVLSLSPVLFAADRPQQKAREKPVGEKVDLFDGIAAGQIDVQFIPKDVSHAKLMVTNKTERPLSIRLPPSFGAAPTLGQIWPGPVPQPNPRQPAWPPNNPNFPNNNPNFPPNNPNFPNNPNNFRNVLNLPPNAPQRLGAAADQAFMNVAPEAVGRLKIDTLCLDHGNPNPHAGIKYAIHPIEDVTDRPGVAEVCELLGQGEIARRAAQLAAWHLSNDMTWEKLSGLRDRPGIGGKPSYTKKEIEAGKEAVEKALDLAKKRRE